MEINKLSAQIDQKLVDLDQRLAELKARQQKPIDDSEQGQLETDIQALELVKNKLVKSRDIAWRAHGLQHERLELEQLARRRQIGLVLCVLSAVGALAILVIFWLTELR